MEVTWLQLSAPRWLFHHSSSRQSGILDTKVSDPPWPNSSTIHSKLRDGLALIKMPADELLKHGNPRVLYAVPLAENFREVLLGRDTKPKYLLSLKKAKYHSHMLAQFWRKRWLSGRITRPGILDQVA